MLVSDGSAGKQAVECSNLAACSQVATVETIVVPAEE